ncbi:MAG: T9SS type A sorting domain-containing protein [Ignavibacteriae bacterium]|nr:T9SS type A sorting domain-containing protein [Ignavibacteriota bacterium]
MKIIITLILFVSQILAQTVYEIPFASKGNEIELSVLNDSQLNLNDVKVSAIEIPDWIKFENEVTEISSLNSQTEGIATFKFDVEQQAKLMEEQTLKFQISGNNQNWEKEIKITILPPDKFELNQNYPNPFNPVTTISYLIPKNERRETSNVNLIIYDILGREVEIIVNEEQRPGYYKTEWNAKNLASGMYIYQISMKNGNKTEMQRKKMMLMK